MTLNEVEQSEVDKNRAVAAQADAEADSARAAAEKTRAEAEKTRADAESVRSTTEAARRAAQNTADVAAADLETKRIANTTAKQTASDAHTDKLITQLTGAVPDLASLGKGSVTFREGKALRQAETTAAALAKAAEDIAKAVKHRVVPTHTENGKKVEGTPTRAVFVVSDPDLVTSVALYRQLYSESIILKDQLAAAVRAASRLVPTAPPGVEVHALLAMTASTATVAAAVTGKIITEVASLFEVDAEVTTNDADISSLSVQAAVIAELLRTEGLTVRHETARITGASNSPLLAEIQELTKSDVTATKVGARLDAASTRLGDPAGALAKAEKDLKDAKTESARTKANKAIANAEAAQERLSKLQNVATDLTAMLAKVRAFAERVVKVPDAGGPTLLSKALWAEPMVTTHGDDKSPLVLYVSGGKAETSQTVVKRRLHVPRVQTSTTVAVDFLLVDQEDVVAGGHETVSAAYAAKISTKTDAGENKWEKIADIAKL